MIEDMPTVNVDMSNPQALVGQRFTSQKLLSTTCNRGLAEVYTRDVLFVIENPAHSKALDLYGGVEASQNPYYSASYPRGDELEVLFSNTQQFEIIGARKLAEDTIELTVKPIVN